MDTSQLSREPELDGFLNHCRVISINREAVLTSTTVYVLEQKYEQYQIFLSENFHYLVVKFSVYLNRYIFIMTWSCIRIKKGRFHARKIFLSPTTQYFCHWPFQGHFFFAVLFCASVVSYVEFILSYFLSSLLLSMVSYEELVLSFSPLLLSVVSYVELVLSCFPSSLLLSVISLCAASFVIFPSSLLLSVVSYVELVLSFSPRLSFFRWIHMRSLFCHFFLHLSFFRWFHKRS